MDDRAALIAAILAEPDDLLPRLVFADYLEDHGEAARAVWMRASCEPGAAVAGSAERRRADGLFAACRPKWWRTWWGGERDGLFVNSGLVRIGAMTERGWRQFVRERWVRVAIADGWIESIWALGWSTAIERWPDPLRGVPLRVFAVHTTTDADLTAILAVPRLHFLALWQRALELPAVARLEARQDLRELTLSVMEHDFDIAPLLVQVGRMTKLRRLSLDTAPRLADADLAPLAGLTGLVRLELRDCPGVSDAAVTELRRALPGADVVRG